MKFLFSMIAYLISNVLCDFLDNSIVKGRGGEGELSERVAPPPINEKKFFSFNCN